MFIAKSTMCLHDNSNAYPQAYYQTTRRALSVYNAVLQYLVRFTPALESGGGLPYADLAALKVSK
jgi:hypothetical protein